MYFLIQAFVGTIGLLGDFLRKQGLDAESRVEDDLYEIYLPEDLGEELNYSIEAFYDEMLNLNQQLFDRERSVSAVFLVLQGFGGDLVVKMCHLRHQILVFRLWINRHHALYF